MYTTRTISSDKSETSSSAKIGKMFRTTIRNTNQDSRVLERVLTSGVILPLKSGKTNSDLVLLQNFLKFSSVLKRPRMIKITLNAKMPGKSSW